jgi:hypothetical protein
MQYEQCGENPSQKHASSFVSPVYLDGAFKCSSCKRNYARISGGSATEELCETCVKAGKVPGAIKMASSRDLNCGVGISYYARDAFGSNFSHVRKDFIFGGENWACSSSKSTYDTLSGRDSYPCGKKANFHIKFPSGFAVSNGNSLSECAVFCSACASRALEIPGTTSLGF